MGTLGFKSKVYVDHSVPGTYMQLPRVEGIEPPAAKVEEVDEPHLDQDSVVDPSGPGTAKGGDLVISMYHDYTWEKRFRVYVREQAIHKWKWLYPNGTEGGYMDGYLKEDPKVDKLENNKPRMMTVTVRQASDVTML